MHIEKACELVDLLIREHGVVHNSDYDYIPISLLRTVEKSHTRDTLEIQKHYPTFTAQEIASARTFIARAVQNDVDVEVTRQL